MLGDGAALLDPGDRGVLEDRDTGVLDDSGQAQHQFGGLHPGAVRTVQAAQCAGDPDALGVIVEVGTQVPALPAGVGAMAAVLGLDDDVVEGVCREASAEDSVLILEELFDQLEDAD